MALNKTKNLANGTMGNYWKITRVSVDRITSTLHCNITLFMNQAVADSTGQSLSITKSFTFPVTKVQLSGDVVALAYALIIGHVNTAVVVTKKPLTTVPTDPDLAGATSC